MSWMIGNQYAVGNNGGRPRTTTPPTEECIILGEELVKWATEVPPEGEIRVHFKQWWSLVKSMSKEEWDLICDTKEFRPYYDKAQISLAIRYIDGTLNPSVSNRFLRLYYPELKQDEDEVAARKNGSIVQAMENLAAMKERMEKREG